MSIASHDTITPTNLALSAYERALEPKRLVLLRGDHFVPYVSAFDAASSAAVDWFRAHMGTAAGDGGLPSIETSNPTSRRDSTALQ